MPFRFFFFLLCQNLNFLKIQKSVFPERTGLKKQPNLKGRQIFKTGKGPVKLRQESYKYAKTNYGRQPAGQDA